MLNLRMCAVWDAEVSEISTGHPPAGYCNAVLIRRVLIIAVSVINFRVNAFLIGLQQMQVILKLWGDCRR